MTDLINRIEGAGPNAAEVLNKAADLIEPEGCWTRGMSARNAHGEYALPKGTSAVCWCAFGAIMRVAGDDLNARFEAEDALQRTVLGRSIVSFNDAPERRQSEVVAALRLAALKSRTTAAGGGA